MTAAGSSPPGLAGSLVKILGYAREQRAKLALVVALSLLDMGLNAQLSLSFKYLIDKAIGEKNEQILYWIAGGLCASIVVVTVSGVWRDRLYASLTGELAAGLRTRLFGHLQRLSAGFFSRTPPGEILSRFSSDLADIERTFLNGVPWGIVPALDALLSTALIFWLDWRLALVGILAFPLSMAGPKLLSARTGAASLERKKAEAGLVSAVAESVSAHSLVRAFALENYFLRAFHVHNLGVRGAGNKLGFLVLLMERSAVVSTQILQVLVMACGGYRVFRGEMSVGTFAAFQSIFVTLTLSLSYLAQYVPQLSQAGGAIAHIEELLAETPQVRDQPGAAALPGLAQGIEFRGVSFSYDGSAMNLDGVDLRIPCGSSAAFVGPSGSGKSTILSLFMRFYDPAGGSVMVDGRDLRTVTQESLRGQTAVVFQDNLLLDATILDNIRIARPGASRTEVDEAIRQAGLWEFVAGLPEGAATVVAQGRLSGGQRQRLGIARALLRDPRILVLDEATSALDSATEATINATIERVAVGRTVLSVTHRLGSAVKADRIFFLDKGRVTEQGSHAELLALNGAYAKMWGKQSGFELSPEGDRASISPDRLRGIPILADLDAGLLAELSRSFTTELLSKDRYVFHEGDSGGKFFILVRGTIEVLKATAAGATRRVEVLQDGDAFGEQALLMNAPRSASARCLAECTLLVLTSDQFQKLIEKAPALRWKLRESATIGEYRNDEAASGTISPWSKFRHDLLTPVNHMTGYSEILEETFGDAGDQASKRHATAACVAARSLHAAVDRSLPSGRTPSPSALAALRGEVAAPLAAIEAAMAALVQPASSSNQIKEDVGRVAAASGRFRAMLADPQAVAGLPQTGQAIRYATASSSAGHILVVDDNDVGRDLLCRKLEREGYRVSAAAGGAAALAMVETAAFDLVLLDVMMPDVDGIEVLQRWRAAGTLGWLPVIVTSALDEVQSAERCIELGAEDYLTKPFDPVLLKVRIAKCLEKKRLKGQAIRQ